MSKIKIIHQGLGPIGRETARLVLNDPELEIVGAVDTNPRYKGKDLGELLEMEKIGIEVTDDIESTLKRAEKPKVLLLATGSALGSIESSVSFAVWNGAEVVSSCEQLFYPESIDRKAAERIDGHAKNLGVRVVGAGVNPGCLMDMYPFRKISEKNQGRIFLIEVCRTDDTSERRESLLKKTGAGRSVKDFYGLSRLGRIGHTGLAMSAAYLADNLSDKLGINSYSIAFRREPVIASENIETKNYGTIEKGYVAGLHETCIVVADEAHRIKLDLYMYADAKNMNSVSIDGKELVNHNNLVNGDIATARILKEAVRNIYHSFPGLNRARYTPDIVGLLSK